ncbi:MAG: T9SS type A sorting domain-containing protein [Saprospiraceae bacterium]|nr:T9SS type A sorting domain-containing protein [Saprospiraceae bacterium]
MKLGYFLLLYLLLFFNNANSQYRQIELFPGQNGTTLINSLFDNFKPNLVLNYTDARVKMYKEIYNVNDTVYCVYSRHGLYLDPAYPNSIDYLAKGGSDNGINCEHTFPQSKGSEFGNARSDMHHLFPSRAAVNEARSNYPFSEIDDNKTKRWFYQSKELNSKPSSLINEYSEGISNFFEPREDHKGNVARAIFYFFTMYDIQADKLFFDTMRNTLCQWHLADPVDSLEWHRSQLIGKYQENKVNPYVLDCSLPARTYCPNLLPCQTTSSYTLASNTFITLYPNPTSDKIYISNNTDDKIMEIEVYNRIGSKIHLTPTFENQSNRFVYNLDDLMEGSYILTIRLQSGAKLRTKFLKL